MQQVLTFAGTEIAQAFARIKCDMKGSVGDKLKRTVVCVIVKKRDKNRKRETQTRGKLLSNNPER